MSRKLKPRMIVKVYYDPITCNDLEGKAKLVKCINPMVGIFDGSQLSNWEVVSLDTSDDYTYSRTINSKHN